MGCDERTSPERWAANRRSSTRRAAVRSVSAVPGVISSESRRSTYRARSGSRSSWTRRWRSRLARSARLRTAWSPKTASSSFWPSTALPPAIPTSAPVRPAVCANTTTINATDRPLTPKARNRAVLRFSAPAVRTISSTPLCHSRTVRSALRRKSRDARPRSSPASASRAWPGARDCHDASARSAAASACSSSRVSRPDSTATVTRSACCGLPLIALTTRSLSQPTRVSSERSSSPVPTNSCQRASTSPRSRVPSAEAFSMLASASS